MNAKKYLPKEVQSLLKGTQTIVKYAKPEEKYSKKKFTYVYKGYDFLENITLVRHYICKRYDITFRFLEILLKLMGLKIFNMDMFRDIPRSFTHNRWKSIVDSGYVNLVMNHNSTTHRLYTLNTKGRNIVMHFYECLSGEKKIPMDVLRNPLANPKTDCAIDRKRAELIRKLNKLEPKKHHRYLFE